MSITVNVPDFCGFHGCYPVVLNGGPYDGLKTATPSPMSRLVVWRDKAKNPSVYKRDGDKVSGGREVFTFIGYTKF